MPSYALVNCQQSGCNPVVVAITYKPVYINAKKPCVLFEQNTLRLLYIHREDTGHT